MTKQKQTERESKTLEQRWQEYFANFNARFPNSDNKATIKRWNIALNIYDNWSEKENTSRDIPKDDPIYSKLWDDEISKKLFRVWGDGLFPGVTREMSREARDVRDKIEERMSLRQMTESEYYALNDVSFDNLLYKFIGNYKVGETK